MEFLFLIPNLLVLAFIGGIVYAVYSWRKRRHDDGPDLGIGTVKRLYFYLVSFVALMMVTAGTNIAFIQLLEELFGRDVIQSSTTELAWGLALIIIGLPLWGFHWRWIQKTVGEIPVERRSIIRKLYLYTVLGIALTFIAIGGYDVIRWLLTLDDFSGFPWATTIVWSVVWAYHWWIESAEGQETVETRGIRRLYLYLASLVGVGVLALSLGLVIHVLLQEGYSAAFAVQVIVPSDSGLWRETMRSAIAGAIVGGLMFWAHWFRFAWTERDSALRWISVFLASVGGGVITGMVGAGIAVYTFVSWATGAADDPNVTHFGALPGALATAVVGLSVWFYFRQRMVLEAIQDETDSVRRVYDHLVAFIGGAALAGASFFIFNTALGVITESSRVLVEGEDLWQTPVSIIITLLLIGLPTWGYFWRRLQIEARDNPVAERTAPSRKIYVFVVLGAGVLALVGSGSWTLFVFLRDLLEAELSVDTLRDLRPPIGVALTAALALPYHWLAYRTDRSLEPEVVEPEPQAIRKRVTLLTIEGGHDLRTTIERALGYQIATAQWADEDAFAPTLTEDQVAVLADEISEAPGSNVILVPAGDGLRVLSHD